LFCRTFWRQHGDRHIYQKDLISVLLLQVSSHIQVLARRKAREIQVKLKVRYVSLPRFLDLQLLRYIIGLLNTAMEWVDKPITGSKFCRICQYGGAIQPFTIAFRTQDIQIPILLTNVSRSTYHLSGPCFQWECLPFYPFQFCLLQH
jgi:hypothetical protein